MIDSLGVGHCCDLTIIAGHTFLHGNEMSFQGVVFSNMK